MTLRLRLLLAMLLVVLAPLGIAYAAVTKAESRFVVIAIGSGIGFALVLAHALSRPWRALADAADKIVHGDFSTRLPVESSDEVGLVAEAINEMSESLRAYAIATEESRTEVRDSVHRLGEALRSTHDLRSMLSVVLETAMSAVQGSYGAVYMINARRTELKVLVGRGPFDRDARLGVGHGLAGWVAQHREGMFFPSVAHAPVPATPEPPNVPALAVPLESQSQLVGVLAIYGKRGHDVFDEKDLETIHSLGRQAGVGIENVLLHREAQRLSITDGMTGVWNRRYFTMTLAREFERAIRFRRSLALLMIDIDHFKRVNDRFGHQRGDAILIDVVRRTLGFIRVQVDTLARYGGEEFVLILPETGAEGARIVAEKIRSEISTLPFGNEDEEPIHVTVSIGYAVYPDDGLTHELLVQAADQAMYEAKTRGRDLVVGAMISHVGALADDPAGP